MKLAISLATGAGRIGIARSEQTRTRAVGAALEALSRHASAGTGSAPLPSPAAERTQAQSSQPGK